MIMGRKRKLLLGNAPIGGKSLKSRRLARSVTSKFHVLNNAISAVATSDIGEKQKATRLHDLRIELNSLGGMEAYQQASVVSTQHFKTSKWIIRTVKAIFGASVNKIKCRSGDGKLDVLEVGAINTDLLRCAELNVRAIDLRSLHPSIEEVDFFTIPTMAIYDVVVSSMVINYVSGAEKRFEMLARLLRHAKPDTGVVFIILPLRCINSPHVGGMARFEVLLKALGCEEAAPKRCTPRLVFYVLRVVKKTPTSFIAPTSHVGAKVKNDNCHTVSAHRASHAVAEESWVAVTRQALSAHGIDKTLLNHFCRDFEAAGSGDTKVVSSSHEKSHFALSIPPCCRPTEWL